MDYSLKWKIGEKALKSKRRLTLYIALASLVIFLTWGMVEPYTIDVEKEEATIPNLPKSWEGKKIIALADFQVGMWLDNARIMEDIVDRVIERKPDVVVLLGDYVYHSVNDHQSEMDKVQSYLKPLTDEDIPVYAVLGNHDYNMSARKVKPNMDTAERVQEKLREIDIEILHNRSVSLETENSEEALSITGIGARWPEKDNISLAFEDLGDEEARFVIMHNPETFDDIPQGDAPTAVAGHTHGGQIRIPFTPHWSWKNLITKGEAHVDGWIKEGYGKEENNLYVNRGVGVSIIPIRFNNPPEITEFHLSGKEE
ncbi:metallophosphoesterase [Guptibacillus algicola]|uniref:metallophosphoesterase n=1 Tax=Guptibacillus algicola TaxID=225844 RepID=UPI001CD360DB|nr:metallophosphoesterase [Alkalihalobacillus algicola]MCA0987212.1 metallophosphoesterase [Alkalihalobacillus algicola]